MAAPKRAAAKNECPSEPSVSGIECRRFTADRNMVILVSPWAEMVASNEVRVTG